jgi:formate-dependent nitrite reductase membrane component NrfD
MNTRIANRISGVLGMLACLWATVMILASDVGAPWKILFELVAVGAFLSSCSSSGALV